MALELVTIPCLKDNYSYLIHDPVSSAVAVVDVPDAAPILAALAARGWLLRDILITHHHADHIAGLEALRAATGARVSGAAADAHRLPPLDHAVADGQSISIGTESGRVMAVPGHTLGHLAWHFAASALVFTGDCLMAMGCGRLFEGSPAQMWHSLSALAALPPETRIASGHEYTEANIRFALTLEAPSPALISRAEITRRQRAVGLPSVPSLLADERATNPFLRAGDPGLKAALGMAGADDAQTFAEIRARKDRF